MANRYQTLRYGDTGVLAQARHDTLALEMQDKQLQRQEKQQLIQSLISIGGTAAQMYGQSQDPKNQMAKDDLADQRSGKTILGDYQKSIDAHKKDISFEGPRPEGYKAASVPELTPSQEVQVASYLRARGMTETERTSFLTHARTYAAKYNQTAVSLPQEPSQISLPGSPGSGAVSGGAALPVANTAPRSFSPSGVQFGGPGIEFGTGPAPAASSGTAPVGSTFDTGIDPVKAAFAYPALNSVTLSAKDKATLSREMVSDEELARMETVGYMGSPSDELARQLTPTGSFSYSGSAPGTIDYAPVIASSRSKPDMRTGPAVVTRQPDQGRSQNAVGNASAQVVPGRPADKMRSASYDLPALTRARDPDSNKPLSSLSVEQKVARDREISGLKQSYIAARDAGKKAEADAIMEDLKVIMVNPGYLPDNARFLHRLKKRSWEAPTLDEQKYSADMFRSYVTTLEKTPALRRRVLR